MIWKKRKMDNFIIVSNFRWYNTTDRKFNGFNFWNVQTDPKTSSITWNENLKNHYGSLYTRALYWDDASIYWKQLRIIYWYNIISIHSYVNGSLMRNKTTFFLLLFRFFCTLHLQCAKSTNVVREFLRNCLQILPILLVGTLNPSLESADFVCIISIIQG